MAYSTKCSKCDNSSFEIKQIEPSGSAYKLSAVQCRSCGTACGVLDYFNLGTLLKNQEKQISDLTSLVQTLRQELQQIARSLR